MTRRHVAAGFLGVFAAACTLAGSSQLALDRALGIRFTGIPASVVAGEPIEVTFAVRNNSARELSLCSPSGVTVHLVSDSPQYVWPITIHGLTTDSECSGSFRLLPGHEKLFTERGTIRRDLPVSKPHLIGVIAIECARDQQRCKGTILRIEQRITVALPGG